MPTTVTKQVTLEIPDGYEWRGEIRSVTNKDWCLWDGPKDGKYLICPTVVRLPILYPIPPAAPPLTVTVKDIYGTDNPAIPQGWRSAGKLVMISHIPNETDAWLALLGDSQFRVGYGSISHSGMIRLQLERAI